MTEARECVIEREKIVHKRVVREGGKNIKREERDKREGARDA